MALNVNSTTRKPSHHVKLTKGSDSIGLILCNMNGNRRDFIDRKPYPKSTIRFQSDDQRYSEAEPPFDTIAIDDFSGGRGMETWEDDKTRYYDAWRMNTLRRGRVILGGQETYCVGDFRDTEQSMPGSVQWLSLYSGGTEYYTVTFTTASAYTPGGASFFAEGVELWLRKRGSPTGNATIELLSAADAQLKSVTLDVSTLDVVSALKFLDWTGTEEIAASTTYKIKISYSSGDSSNYIQVGGSSASFFYYRLIDNVQAFNALFFEYKRALYMVMQPDAGNNSFLYINGDRGVADSNSGTLDRLIDASKSWADDEHNGEIVLITKGPGSEEAQPWRTVVDTFNNGGSPYVTVDTNWNVEHTTATEYVFIGSNKFTQLLDLGDYVTDVKVADEFVYFARGDTGSSNVLRYQWYNNAGVEATQNDAEAVKARCLRAISHPTLGYILLGGWNGHDRYGNTLWYGVVPQQWGDLVNSLGGLADTDQPWDGRPVTNVTQSVDEGRTKIAVAAGFGTGIVAVENLSTATDITKGGSLGVYIESDVDTNAGDLKLVYDDQPDLGKEYSPTGLEHYDGAAYNEMTNAKDGDAATNHDLTMQTDDYIYVGFNTQYNKATVDVGSTPNAVASVMSGEYFDGKAWTSLSSFSDGTASGGVTLAQDGDISFDVPYDWALSTIDSQEYYWIRLKVSVNLTANVLINGITVTRRNNVELSIPALVAGEEAWAAISISPLEHPLPNETLIQSVGIKVSTDNGAQNIYLRGGVQVLGDAMEFESISNNALINSIEAYSGNETDPRENPWIITENKPYEMQMQNSNVIVPIPLREMDELRSEHTGKAHTVNNVYMYFNLGRKVQRYYNRTMDDVGPDLDAGMPSARQGVPACMASYPGLVVMAYDGEESNISSVLTSRGSTDWHELYRAPRTGQRIRSVHVQAIPGQETSRLWISMGSDVLWVPLALNPEECSEYRYCHEATLHIGRVLASAQDLEKFYKSVKLLTENLSSTITIACDYKLDSASSWTTITGTFNTSPSQEVNLTSDHSASGKWMELRLRAMTEDNTTTPVLLAVVLECLKRFTVKWYYPMVFRVKDRDLDLNSDPDPTPLAQTKINLLDTWITSPLPVLMSSISSMSDNIYVYPEATPVKMIKKFQDEHGDEVRICQIDLLGI